MSFLRRVSHLADYPWARHPAWRFFYIGLGIKRWLLLLFIGVTLLSLGTAYLLVEIYREQPLPDFVFYLTLQFLPRPLRALIVGGGGLALILYSLYRLSDSIWNAYGPRRSGWVETLYRKRQRQGAIKIVVIGGGSGMSILLRGLKNYTENLTAIITVADDGGSSGRLREELGLLPPGDFRQCIAALADAEPLMTRLFEYRFAQGNGLSGHSFGNLFIAAMAGITGNFEDALFQSSRVLAVRGRIVPSTLENVTLCAEVRGSGVAAHAHVIGESQIAKFGQPVERVYLEPETVSAYPGAVRAILDADLIIAGPGSLFTSVVPNLLVRDICAAVSVSPALKLYVCNVATERGETDGYSVQDHVRALDAHCGGNVFEYVMVNNNWAGVLPAQAHIDFVKSNEAEQNLPGHVIVTADVVDDRFPWRHDPDKLGKAIVRWFQQKRNVNVNEFVSIAPKTNGRKNGNSDWN